jgi:hypothetical protein
MSLDVYSNENLTARQIDLKNTIIFEITGGIEPEIIDEIPEGTTLDDLFLKVKNLVDTNGRFDDRRILFTDTMSDGNIFQDPDLGTKDLAGLIINSVLKRTPATLVGGNDPFNRGRRDLKPKLVRKIIGANPERPGEVSWVLTSRYDNLVGFTIVAQTNKWADELADWFESLIETNRWYFVLNGYQVFYFDERTADVYVDFSTFKATFRPYKYYVRTETNYVITESQLNKLIVQIST